MKDRHTTNTKGAKQSRLQVNSFSMLEWAWNMGLADPVKVSKSNPTHEEWLCKNHPPVSWTLFEAENIECKTQFQLDKTFEHKLWETDLSNLNTYYLSKYMDIISILEKWPNIIPVCLCASTDII